MNDKRKNNFAWAKWGAIAACVVLVVLCVPKITRLFPKVDDNGEYNEAVAGSDLTKDTSEFFCGSYTDANGKFVIVLTEDTSANRAAICKELGRNESNTTFVKGTYTLEYLTELQEKITQGMINKEFPFVVTSGVYETTNNIVIRVTTNNEEELKKVYALDTIGGAIQVEYGTGAENKGLLLPKAE